MQKCKFLLLILVCLNSSPLQAADNGKYTRNCLIVGTIIFVAVAVEIIAALRLPTSQNSGERPRGKSALERMRAAVEANKRKEKK